MNTPNSLSAVILVILIFFNANETFSQGEEPPTLSMGLDHLVFGKGVIDVELLSDIIANKQDELKREFIKRNLVKLVGNNFTYYNYTLNTLELILKEKNKKVITREMLEYTSNLALVYGLSELYIELTLKSKTTTAGEDVLDKVLTRFNVNKEELKIEEGYIFKLEHFKDNRFRNKNGSATDFYFPNVLIDLVFDICRNNYAIQNRGFFLQALNIINNEYDSLNQYRLFDKFLKQNDKEMHGQLDLLRKDIENKMISFFEYYEIFKESDFMKGTVFNDFLNMYKGIIQDKFAPETKNVLNEIIYKLNEVEKRRSVAAEEMRKITEQLKETDILKSLKIFYTKLPDIDTAVLVDNKLMLGTSQVTDVKQIKEYIANLDETKLVNNFGTLQLLTNSLTSILPKINGADKQLQKELEALNEIVNLKSRYYGFEYELTQSSAEKAKLDSQKNEIASKLEMYKASRDVIFKLALGEIRKVLLNLQLSKEKDTSNTISKIYKVVTALENPNRKGQDISFANYILDSLNTSIIEHLGPYDPAVNGLLSINSVNTISTNASNNISKLITQFELIAYKIKYDAFVKFGEKGIPKLGGFEKEVHLNTNNFIDFITQLNELDKASTYDYLFKSLVDAGVIFKDIKGAKAFNNLINNIKKYVITDDTNNEIEFDVEGLIVLLYDIYGDQKNSPISLYFGIGLNTAFQVEKALNLEDDTVSTLSFASEKIGLKLKICDFKRIYADQQRLSKPLISDWYTFAYGSGLLYNLVNVKSSKNFNATIIGFGTGLSFYNFLDFNISTGIPLMNDNETSNWCYRFFNVGFDIKISEYLSEVAKKRRLNKKTN
jgi:hypothetical protein